MTKESILKYADHLATAATEYCAVPRDSKFITGEESAAKMHLEECLRDWNDIRRNHLSKFPIHEHYKL